jgi:hypothetical protein
LIQAFAGDVGSHYMQMSTYLNNFQSSPGLEVIIFGPPNIRAPRILSKGQRSACPTDFMLWRRVRVCRRSSGGRQIMQEGQPTAYVCGGMVCSRHSRGIPRTFL